MPTRIKNFDPKLSQELISSFKSRQKFILRLLKKKLSIEEALVESICHIGQLEFAQMVACSTSSINDIVKRKRKLKRESLDKLLDPFGLKTELKYKIIRKT